MECRGEDPQQHLVVREFPGRGLPSALDDELSPAQQVPGLGGLALGNRSAGEG